MYSDLDNIMFICSQTDQRAADPGWLGGCGALGAGLGEDAALADARRQLHVLSSNNTVSVKYFLVHCILGPILAMLNNPVSLLS